MKKLAADIKNHSFSKVYLLYGNEEYLKSAYFRKLSAAVAGDDTMNRMEIDGREVSLAEVHDFTDTMPFFAEKRLLLLTDTGLFTESREGFADWILTLPETACVIFKEEKIDKRSALYKAVRDTGYVSEMDHPDEKTFSDWVLRRIGSHQIQISRDAFTKLLAGLERDLLSAGLEVDKICDCFQDKGTILPEDLDEIMTVHIENRIFDLVEQVCSGNRERALELYYDLLSLKESPMRILYLMGRQVNQIYLAAEFASRHMSRAEIAAALNLSKSGDYIVGKLLQEAKHFSSDELRTAIEKCVEFDEAVKSGNLSDTLAVELFIFHMTDRKKDGR